MTINLHTLGISGTALVWLGGIVCVLSLALFIAVSTGIHVNGAATDQTLEGGPLTFHHKDFIIPGGKDRLMFLLPLAAGVMLAVSGVFIRSKIPEYRETFQSIGSYFEHEASDADGDASGQQPAKEREDHR